MHNNIKFFLLILIISSCGGGGGGSSSSGSSGTAPTPSAPSFNSFIANSDLIVINNDVTLTWSTSNTNCAAGHVVEHLAPQGNNCNVVMSPA